MIADFKSYIPVPDDRIVALADIRGSTKEIQDGRYKEVNMAGAASITAILNACNPLDVPFVLAATAAPLFYRVHVQNRLAAHWRICMRCHRFQKENSGNLQLTIMIADKFFAWIRIIQPIMKPEILSTGIILRIRNIIYATPNQFGAPKCRYTDPFLQDTFKLR